MPRRKTLDTSTKSVRRNNMLHAWKWWGERLLLLHNLRMDLNPWRRLNNWANIART